MAFEGELQPSGGARGAGKEAAEFWSLQVIAGGFISTCSSYHEPARAILFCHHKSLLCPFCLKHSGSAITTLDIYFISTITLICQVYFLCTAGVP